ncbi:MAG: 2-dehydropantoate 2-reductase [Sulfurospirillaceae bacterium]|nr:2-dehydropantoate 2-reductase [Sulfurospirillaceae bacterium]MDD2825919.1 2-dehydropantoate 2-reductase [Sulfurospirillaceae bacterium]
MKCIILGAGGVGCYYGVRLIRAGHEVIFVARGEHLENLNKNGLTLTHPEINFCEAVKAISIEQMKALDMSSIDLVIIATKSTATHEIGKVIQECFQDLTRIPYCLSLQNGVENEDILCNYIDSNYIIGGLTRKIGAHIMRPGIVNAVGESETIVGLIHPNSQAEDFLKQLSLIFNEAFIPTEIVPDIRKELWKKLIINNGVNALCALLEVKTGIVMHHSQLNLIVLGLMKETALAAQALHVKVTEEEVKAMFDLILGFDSIKPSMLVDVEHRRPLEIEEICGVVIRYCKLHGFDAPVTQTIYALLNYKMENLQ